MKSLQSDTAGCMLVFKMALRHYITLENYL